MRSTRARTFYQKAAEGGDGYAQWRLGKAYKYGELGLAIDLQVADMWDREADASAQWELRAHVFYLGGLRHAYFYLVIGLLLGVNSVSFLSRLLIS